MLTTCDGVVRSTPYYNDPFEHQQGEREVSEYLITTTGANYELAKHTAAETGSHLITDLLPRWWEIEIDRESSGIDARKWSPFAKAFHALTIKYLDNVPLKDALRLRSRRSTARHAGIHAQGLEFSW